MQRIGKANMIPPRALCQIDNKTETDGIVTTEELALQMRRAGQMTKEAIAKMYPKDAEYEKNEAQMIADDKITQMFYEADLSNKEKIEAIFKRNNASLSIKKSVKELERLEKERQKHKENIELEILKYKNTELENQLKKHKKDKQN